LEGGPAAKAGKNAGIKRRKIDGAKPPQKLSGGGLKIFWGTWSCGGVKED